MLATTAESSLLVLASRLAPFFVHEHTSRRCFAGLSMTTLIFCHPEPHLRRIYRLRVSTQRDFATLNMATEQTDCFAKNARNDGRKFSTSFGKSARSVFRPRAYFWKMLRGAQHDNPYFCHPALPLQSPPVAFL
jgi:hypothetical protein